MAGFIRRFGFFPGTEVITLIEGVVIVDLPPPGAINGVGAGTVCCVGEFADVTYGVAVDTSGNVTTSPQPVEVFSGQDLADKVGGFDETIGDTGISGGNGFIALRNKKFSRLVVVPINLASPKATRVWRTLPTNASATRPVPIVTLAAGAVLAGREFKASANRARIMKKVIFTSIGHYTSGVDGAVVSAGAGVTQSFTAAGASFLTAKNGGPVQAGDLLVVGMLGAAGAQGANADTYRVTADATSATALTVEKQAGTSFDWTTGGSLAWRVHPNTDAESGAGPLSAIGACTIPTRPLDATIAAATVVAPSIVPAGPGTDGKAWEALTGLTLRTHATGTLVYAANVQAANAVYHVDLAALYALCFDALLAEESPARDVNILVPARTGADIRTAQKAHVLSASSQGVGRTTIMSPELTVVTVDGALAALTSGYRHERVDFCWPGAQTFIPEAVGYAMKGADGFTHTDGNIDTHLNMWLAAVLSNLPPERNPGQGTAPVPEIMAPITRFQRLVGGLTMSNYMAFKSAGIAALRIDRKVGPIFQSGITTSLTSGEKNINRRRMADFLEDSMADRFVSFSKLPLTPALKDTLVGEADAFLAGLLSANNPPAQRISGYLLDDKSGNTPDLEAKGIFVLIAKVRTLATADDIVLQVEAGEGVTVTAA